MRNEARRFHQEAWKYPDKTFVPHGLGLLVRRGFFIIAIGVAGLAAFVALLHVAEVIP